MGFIVRLAAVVSLLAFQVGEPFGAAAASEPDCVRGTGIHDGYFYTSWRDSGAACMTLGEHGRYAVTWDLRPGGNLVVGKGWSTGAASRTVGYRAAAFEPGSKELAR